MSRTEASASHETLSIIIRPRCPKCKKEFMLNLKSYLPGKQHACYGCGTVTPYDAALAERTQKQIKELETSIREIFERFWSD